MNNKLIRILIIMKITKIINKMMKKIKQKLIKQRSQLTNKLEIKIKNLQ